MHGRLGRLAHRRERPARVRPVALLTARPRLRLSPYPPSPEHHMPSLNRRQSIQLSVATGLAALLAPAARAHTRCQPRPWGTACVSEVDFDRFYRQAYDTQHARRTARGERFVDEGADFQTLTYAKYGRE